MLARGYVEFNFHGGYITLKVDGYLVAMGSAGGGKEGGGRSKCCCGGSLLTAVGIGHGRRSIGGCYVGTGRKPRGYFFRFADVPYSRKV